jgi:hypothetical protein
MNLWMTNKVIKRCPQNTIGLLYLCFGLLWL